MPTTTQMRNQYPDLIIGGVDAQWNVIGDRPKCNYSSTTKVRFAASGPSYPQGFVELKFHPSAADWARSVAAVMRHHKYYFRETSGGSCVCRKITGGLKTSLHAHGCVFDINPSKNAYRKTVGGGLIQWGRHTDMTKTMIRDIEAIVTVDGYRTTSWGGRWTNSKDPMHFECSKVTRIQLEKGIRWASVVGWAEYKEWLTADPTPTPTPVEEERMYPTLDLSHVTSAKATWIRGEIVKSLQGLLVAREFAPANTIRNDKVDGIAGPGTRKAVGDFQTAKGLKKDFIVGKVTWTALEAF